MVSEEEVLFLRIKEQIQDLRREERLGNVTVENLQLKKKKQLLPWGLSE